MRHAGAHAFVHGKSWGRIGSCFAERQLGAYHSAEGGGLCKNIGGGPHLGSLRPGDFKPGGSNPRVRVFWGGESTVVLMVLEVWWTCDCHYGVVVEGTWGCTKATFWGSYDLDGGSGTVLGGHVLGVGMTGTHTM